MIELGHKSTPLKNKLPNGYTHKWTAYVRGRNNAKIENCIQRVVFQLHESFDNPHRGKLNTLTLFKFLFMLLLSPLVAFYRSCVLLSFKFINPLQHTIPATTLTTTCTCRKLDITEPPFQIKETGYAGFEIPIEIYFKNKEKPNHVVFVYDLCLLTDRPHENFISHKLKFRCPGKEFEKCLVRSGAHLLSTTKEKKERSHSPPTKKQKSSSSLIPSKDMSKQPPSSNQTQPQQPQQQQSQQPQQSQRKTTSKEFIDVFGAPLVYNSSHNNNNTSQKHNSRETEQARDLSSFVKEEPHQQQHQTPRLTHAQTNSHSQHQQQSHHQTSTQVKLEKLEQQSQSQLQTHSHVQTLSHSQNSQTHPNSSQTDSLQILQTKISSLTDVDRLQKIVDIIEESGEWFNVTSKKFEFDLKRLDKKTLSKIEKCLSNQSNHYTSANSYKR